MPLNPAARESILRRAYAAFNTRDIPAAIATMLPDVDWPNGMEGGRVLGHEAIREYWTRQWGIIDPTVEPVCFSDDGEGVTVDVRQVVRDREGLLLADTMVRHVYRFHGDLIQRMDIHAADPSAATAISR